jgi:hypothetical protein
VEHEGITYRYTVRSNVGDDQLDVEGHETEAQWGAKYKVSRDDMPGPLEAVKAKPTAKGKPKATSKPKRAKKGR